MNWEPLPLALGAAHRADVRQAKPSTQETEDPARWEFHLRDLGSSSHPWHLPWSFSSPCHTMKAGIPERAEGVTPPYVTKNLPVDRTKTTRYRGLLACCVTKAQSLEALSQGQTQPSPDSQAQRLLLGCPPVSRPVLAGPPHAVPVLGQWFGPPYHGCQAGNVFDRILDLLFGHFDQRAVLVLRWQRLRPMPRDPGVQLQRMTGGVRGRQLAPRGQRATPRPCQ